jgi:hypothetical protein
VTRWTFGELRRLEAAAAWTNRLDVRVVQSPQSPFVCAKARLRLPIGTPALAASA